METISFPPGFFPKLPRGQKPTRSKGGKAFPCEGEVDTQAKTTPARGGNKFLLLFKGENDLAPNSERSRPPPSRGALRFGSEGEGIPPFRGERQHSLPICFRPAARKKEPPFKEREGEEGTNLLLTCIGVEGRERGTGSSPIEEKKLPSRRVKGKGGGKVLPFLRTRVICPEIT